MNKRVKEQFAALAKMSDAEVVLLGKPLVDSLKNPVLLELVYRLEKRVLADKAAIPEDFDPNMDMQALCVCGHAYLTHYNIWTDCAPTKCRMCDCEKFELKV